MFKRLGFAKVSYDSLDRCLEEEYQKVFVSVKSSIQSRKPTEPIAVSFDKWTESDGNKFIGVHLYVSGKIVFLGMILFRGFCGSEEIVTH